MSVPKEVAGDHCSTQRLLNGGGACIDMPTHCDYTKICISSFHTPSHTFCNSCLHTSECHHPHKHTLYVTDCLCVGNPLSRRTVRRAHLDHRAKLSTTRLFILMEPQPTLVTYVCTTDKNLSRHTHLSSSRSRFTRTGFTPPTWLISSHPFLYSLFLASHLPLLCPAEQCCRPVRPVQPASLSAHTQPFNTLTSRSPAHFPPPLCLPHTC